MSDPVLRLEIGENPAPRLDKALAAVAPEASALSRSRLGKLIESGSVTRENGEVVTGLKTRTFPGEVWLVAVGAPETVDAIPQDIPLTIIHEDADLIVIDKPAGMVVHPAPGAASGTLVNALLYHCAGSLSGIGGERRPGIVHRIDKNTTGLLVAAKSDRAHQGLASQFAAHTVDRHYLAVVHGVPSQADPRLAGVSGVAFEASGVIRISGNIARHKTERKKMAVQANTGRHAITRLRVQQDFGGSAALVDCWLETGRTHQIRVHLAHAGHGLIGDPVYGGRRKLAMKSVSPQAVGLANAFQRQALHAATLGFVHPVSGREMAFTADLPQDMRDLVQSLAGA